MGQIDSALVCYQKSALLLERSTKEHVVNQGFIRAWIAELLVARQRIKLAYVFFRAAYIKWHQTAPPRAAQMHAMAAQFASRAGGATEMDDAAIESLVIDWILGQEVDSRIENLNVEDREMRHG
jgi:hypothetical protein